MAQMLESLTLFHHITVFGFICKYQQEKKKNAKGNSLLLSLSKKNALKWFIKEDKLFSHYYSNQ